MKELKLPPCHIEFYYGHEMHTHRINFSDEATWIYYDCDESLIEDDVQYKVWCTTTSASDPYDSSYIMRVYHFERVPEEFLEMKKKVDEYWSSKEPIEF